MAVKSAWGGGGVWGATASKAGDVADYEGEDACGICLNAPEAVSLQPCKHKICEACVARMRYQLISKASNVCVDMLVGAWTWLHEPTQAFTHVLNTYLNACLARTSWHVLPPWPATDFGSLGQCRLTTVSPVPSAAAWWLGTGHGRVSCSIPPILQHCHVCKPTNSPASGTRSAALQAADTSGTFELHSIGL